MNRNDYARQAARAKARGEAAKERRKKERAWLDWVRRMVRGKPRVIVMGGTRYVVDPVTAQWWREGKWQAKQQAK